MSDQGHDNPKLLGYFLEPKKYSVGWWCGRKHMIQIVATKDEQDEHLGFGCPTATWARTVGAPEDSGSARNGSRDASPYGEGIGVCGQSSLCTEDAGGGSAV